MSSSRQNSSDKDHLSIDQEALALSKHVQKPGQTKEQTRLVAQGIAKGIELYKRQQSAKARERDKTRKKWLKARTSATEEHESRAQPLAPPPSSMAIKWLLIAFGVINLLWYFVPLDYRGTMPGIVSGLAIATGLMLFFLPERRT